MITFQMKFNFSLRTRKPAPLMQKNIQISKKDALEVSGSQTKGKLIHSD